MKSATLWALGIGLCACGTEEPALSPSIVTPPSTSTAYPYDGVDTLSLSLARAGDDRPIQEVSVPVGQSLELPVAPFARDMVVHLSGLSSGVEISYGRTCAVDVLRDEPIPDVVLYFARVVRWSTAEQPQSGQRIGGMAYATRSGHGLFVGGDEAGTIERYDATLGHFEKLEVATSLRTGGVLAPLSDGRAAIVGGRDEQGELLSTIELLDPSPELPPELQLQYAPGLALLEHIAVTLVDGSVLVSGGLRREAEGPLLATRRAWLVRFGSGDVQEPPEELSGRMTESRAGHTATRMGDEVGADVLIIGGYDDVGVSVATGELYRPLRGVFEPLPNATLTVPRWAHQAIRMPGGFVLVLGGFTNGPDGSTPVTEMELYDPAQGRFTSAGQLPPDAGISEQSVTPLADGRVLLAGGRDIVGEPVAKAFIARLDPISGQVDVIPTDSLGLPRANHNAVRLCDGTVLVVGGSSEATTPSARYNPPSLGRR